MNDLMNCYYNSNMASIPQEPSSGTVDALKVISGRVSVHGIGFSEQILNPSNLSYPYYGRPFILCGSTDMTDIYYKLHPVHSVNGFGQSFVIHPTGGNGILFPDGVFLAKSLYAPQGSGVPVQDYARAIAIFYTGGANT
jgi:hypothetical protein